ncbi:hypothetical protein ABGB17_37075 [Sphaerisporangium sp. B11E5]|uniref:hypothetical protein n=1 Tax=Sphaerisporangium sp. B11E5 TaxID=3153563 RepID=UPI00325D8DD4
MRSPLSTARAPGSARRLAVALGAVLAVVGLGPAPADAAPTPGPAKDSAPRAVEPVGEVPGGFASWKDLLVTQDKLVSAADRVTAAVKAGDGTGFAGIVAAPENRELRVYWKGDTPASIAGLVGLLRRDVPVRVLPAAYSARELERETNRLIRTSGGALTSITPNADGSGLTVSGADRGLARAKVAGSAVPVTVEEGVTPAPAYSRWNDSAPWWGGAAWRIAGSTQTIGCSTGFAVTLGGATRMLSAGHCGTPGQVATDPTNEVIGAISYVNVNRDLMLITTNAGARVYNNDFAATPPEWGNPVAGATGSYTGMYICTSGAYSGTVCLCQVRATNITIYTGNTVLTGMVLAEHTEHKNAAGQGDSGGPVENPSPTNTSRQNMLGTISFIDTSAPATCTGYVTSGRVCSWRLYYSPWSNALAAFPGIAIVTG